MKLTEIRRGKLSYAVLRALPLLTELRAVRKEGSVMRVISWPSFWFFRSFKATEGLVGS